MKLSKKHFYCVYEHDTAVRPVYGNAAIVCPWERGHWAVAFLDSKVDEVPEHKTKMPLQSK